MTALAFPWNDETDRPTCEKAEGAVDAFRYIHGCDPLYLRVSAYDNIALEAAGFDDVEVVVCDYVQDGCFYAVRP